MQRVPRNCNVNATSATQHAARRMHPLRSTSHLHSARRIRPRQVQVRPRDLLVPLSPSLLACEHVAPGRTMREPPEVSQRSQPARTAKPGAMRWGPMWQGASPVSVQMWVGVSPIPAPTQMWQGASPGPVQMWVVVRTGRARRAEPLPFGPQHRLQALARDDRARRVPDKDPLQTKTNSKRWAASTERNAGAWDRRDCGRGRGPH